MKRLSSLLCILLVMVMFAFSDNSVNAAPKTATVNSKGAMGS